MAEHRFPIGDPRWLLRLVVVTHDRGASETWLCFGVPDAEPFTRAVFGSGVARGVCVAQGPDPEKELVDLAEAVSKALACLREAQRG